ncbi:MAG: Gfo/Idh/MocA family oxidoreductase [Candidatus Hydrogenedentes bacterium]|nr:Gfo/Idh/MocA family oxidoreductase [Candidatus Hydrogenedentota bacterium]
MTPQDVARGTLNRRQFLKRGAAGTAAALALPNIIPATALGAEGATPASDRISIGLIGMGKMMGGHVGTLLGRSDCQIVAVCDVEAGRLETYKQRVNEFYAQKEGAGSFKGCEAYGDYRELLARADIDAVLIATPEHWHALQVVDAAKAGKDIYCEKPLSHTIHEARAMVNAVRRYGRVFQTGSQQRSSREFRVACELVRNGRIGTVQTIHVNVGGPPTDCYLPAEPTPEGLNWDMWLGPAPYRPYHSDIAPPVTFGGWPNWREYRDYSGGMMCDWGAHHFDIAQWGLGMDGSGPVEIYAPGTGGYDLLTYKYANGVVMHHGGGSGGRAGVEFIGSEGRVMVNRGYIETDPGTILDTPILPDDIHLYHSDNHHDDWFKCMRTRNKPICDVEVGCSSITVCHLGNTAYRLKRPLKWDPAAEQYVDDEEANRTLSRPMRSPWTLA